MNRNQRRALAKSRDPRNLVQIADLHDKAGRFAKAEETYRQAIAMDPRCYEAHNNLGILLRAAGRVAEAIRHFVLAIEIDPENALVGFNLAACLSGQKRFTDAVHVYRQVVALNPANADAQYGLAFALTQLGEHEEAERHYLEALNIDPLHFQARINLGLALVDRGKVVEAFSQAQILAGAETATGFPHKAFGILLARAGCPDGAKLCFENHLKQHPGERDDIAMLLAAVGGSLPARATDQQIVRLYKSQADGWDGGAAGPTGYRGHRLIADALVRLNAGRADIVIDAGCGTGLVGELLRADAGRLIGVDMSEPMLAQARQKNVYDELHRGDLVEYLNSHHATCDLIVSAATLIHFGDLDAVFAAAARCLRADGLFVFTAFPNDDDPAAVAVGRLDGLAQGGCFRHGTDYIAATASRHGFGLELLHRDVHEYARKAPLLGLVVALRLAA